MIEEDKIREAVRSALNSLSEGPEDQGEVEDPEGPSSLEETVEENIEETEANDDMYMNTIAEHKTRFIPSEKQHLRERREDLFQELNKWAIKKR